eukprot:580857-Pleurochrysis_carterae.AAC.1
MQAATREFNTKDADTKALQAKMDAETKQVEAEKKKVEAATKKAEGEAQQKYFTWAEQYEEEHEEVYNDLEAKAEAAQRRAAEHEKEVE